MHIAIIGYGKMGKAIEALALDKGYEISIIRNSGETGLLKPGFADVAIEFTRPDCAAENLKKCIGAGIPVVCGTTGWLSEKKSVEEFCRIHHGAFFYTSNFSLGVNLFFRLNKFLAQLMAGQRQYDPSITEIHHTQKKDAPSGTAITLAEGIIGDHRQYSGWVSGETNVPLTHAENKGVIPVYSERTDPFPGKHTVRFTSSEDEISITHEAFSRKGFAAGALAVAEWLPGHTGALGMDDFLRY